MEFPSRMQTLIDVMESQCQAQPQDDEPSLHEILSQGGFSNPPELRRSETFSYCTPTHPVFVPVDLESQCIHIDLNPRQEYETEPNFKTSFREQTDLFFDTRELLEETLRKIANFGERADNSENFVMRVQSLILLEEFKKKFSDAFNDEIRRFSPVGSRLLFSPQFNCTQLTELENNEDFEDGEMCKECKCGGGDTMPSLF